MPPLTMDEQQMRLSRVSHMLTRVDTLKRNSTLQANYFKNFDERLQRLEDMQSSTLQMLNVLVQNMSLSSNSQPAVLESAPTRSIEKKRCGGGDEDDDDEPLNFTGVSTPDDAPSPMASLMSSAASRALRPSGYPNRKLTTPIPTTAPPQIIVGAYSELLSLKSTSVSTSIAHDERLVIGTSASMVGISSALLNVPDDSSHQNLYQAEETEHSIYGKLIKERFRKLSEVVEDIERTLPSHQQRHDEKCDTIDDDETLSTIDWIDTAGRLAFNSTRASRIDVNQDDPDQHVIATVDHLTYESEQCPTADALLVHPPVNNERKST